MDYPNWFQNSAIGFFEYYLRDYAGQPNLKYLQIGTYTGDASLWLLRNILIDSSSTLTDVDTWEGSEEEAHKEFNWKSLEDTYDSKLIDYSNVIKYKGNSLEFLKSAQLDYYDFIYIDGDHTEAGVYSDAVNAWDKLKSGGIMAFDDYHWHHESGLDELRPAPAIDRFVAEHADSLRVLEIAWQYWIVKK
jgi:predicted O-methyltransferase YrrM